MEGSWLHTKWTRKWSLSVVSDSLWPMDCSLPGSSVRGIFQASILEWVTISSPRGSSWPRKWTWVSCIAGRFFTNWVTREATKENGSEIRLLYEQYLPSIIITWNFLSSSFQASGLYIPGWRREMGCWYMCLPDWNVIKQFLFSDFQVSSAFLIPG